LADFAASTSCLVASATALAAADNFFCVGLNGSALVLEANTNLAVAAATPFAEAINSSSGTLD